MGGPGSGRRKIANGSNGHPVVGPRVTFGDLFGKITPPAAAAPFLPPPQTPAPTPPPAPPPPSPAESSGNRSFAKMAGYVSTNIGVAVIGDHLRRRRLEPREVSREDLERTEQATSDAIVRSLGDMEVPWWAGLATAWGNLYLAMRVGARPLPAADTTTAPSSAAAATTTTTTTPPPAPSPLGQVPPPRKPPPPPPAPGGYAPEIAPAP